MRGRVSLTELALLHCLPDLHSSILTRRGNIPPIMGPLHVIDLLRVTAAGKNMVPVSSIPCLDDSNAISRCDTLSFGRKSQAPYISSVDVPGIRTDMLLG